MTDLLTNEATSTQTAIPPVTEGRRPWKWAAAVVGIAAVLGFAGGITSHALFPAQNGKPGVAGKQGPAGEQGPVGPQGPAGTAGKAGTDLGTTGYCFTTNYSTDPYSNASYVSGVSLYAPNNTNGTLSCPSGTFVPLAPTPSPTA